MAEKPEKVFTTILEMHAFVKLESIKKAVCMLPVIMWGMVIGACNPDLTDDPIPFIPFSPIHINLNLPQYQNLNTLGYVYIAGGVRGILLYRSNASTYIAYERNCTYHPNDACATIEMHSSNLYIMDPCCNSSFTLSTGDPAGGPAWRPLRKYETFLSGSEITITDTIVD